MNIFPLPLIKLVPCLFRNSGITKSIRKQIKINLPEGDDDDDHDDGGVANRVKVHFPNYNYIYSVKLHP